MAKTIISEEKALKDKECIEKIISNIETVIVGKRKVVEMTVLCLLAKGHILIEDVPGVGKTSLVLALARSIDCPHKRIQFTPDIMPSDITGFSIYNQKTGEFEFREGSAMSNMILADEINRASAKTQSALLEVMEERQVTVDSHTYKMDSPYMVLATQNPLESMGTYRLPEAQVDRFMIKLSIGYPEHKDEVNILMNVEEAKKTISSVTTKDEVNALIEDAENVKVSKLVASYIVSMVAATRKHIDIKLGSSPRGAICLQAMSRAYALLSGRNYVTPDDVKAMAPYVLTHRISLTNGAKNEKKKAEDIISEIIKNTIVPVASEEE